jgi:acetyl-CoA acetyltransferase
MSLISAGLGMTGVPVFNVNNNCSSGSTGIMMARYLVLAGHDCTLAVGKERSMAILLPMNHLRLQYL